jgi:predicted MFS family arabinose efflux permease
MSGHLFFCLLFLSTDCDWKTAIMSIIKDEATVTAKRPPSLWRNRDYMLLWSGQMVSSIGTEVSTLAFPLLILALTGSPATAGFAGALRALPYLVFSLPAGALIDRWDRKRVMILCDSGRALSMASIPVALAFGYLSILQIYGVSLIEGTLFVFFNLAEVACLPRVVTKEQLPAASAQHEVSFGITALIGPSLGGALYSVARMLPFLGDAISYAASVGSLFLIRTKFQQERVATRQSIWVDIREGLVWLWKQPLIRFMAILTGGYNLIFPGFTLITIVLAQRQHASSLTIGLIFAAGGIGAIVGAIFASFLQKRLSFAQAIIGATCLIVIATPLYAIAPNAVALGAVAAFNAAIGPLYNVVQFSYRLALIPDALQGRVNSVFRLIAFGGQPLGLALTGLLIQNVGVISTILLCTAGLGILAVATIANKHVRNARSIA